MQKTIKWSLMSLLLALPATAELQNVSLGRASQEPPVPASLEHLAKPMGGVDSEFLERYALAADRAAVLAELVPGTDAYFYFNGLHQLDQGNFDEGERLLKAWVDGQGEGPGVTRIRHRLAVLRYPQAPEDSLAYLKAHLDLDFDHQRQVPGEVPDLPTALDPSLISREKWLARALDDAARGETVDAFRPSAYPWLLQMDLSPERRRDLLQELTLPDLPGLAEHIAADLDAPNSKGFGSMQIHTALLRSQLDALAELRPGLLQNDAFVNTYVQRLKPGYDDPNWPRNPDVMAAYLDRLWVFAEGLAPAQNTLKAHVLYHRLAFEQTQGTYNKARFLRYLQLPRPMDYVNPDYLKQSENRRYTVDLSRDFGSVTGLSAVHSDQALVRDFLQHFFASGESIETFSTYIRTDFLRPIYAETQLLQGTGDMEQWYAWLDPGAVDALKNRVDIAFAPENKKQFARAESVALDVWVKNVDRLLVKVFEIDTRSYYQEFDRDINADIALDGLVANQEQVYTYDEPPLRRVRRTFTFPELMGRGVWVVEFVGNGTSSRAVVAKGSLQHLTRTTSQGQRVTVFNESGEKVPDAEIWYGGRTYTADGNGEIALPFSTEPGTRHLLLCHRDFASRVRFEHQGENYRLATGFHVDGESLRSGATADVAVRPVLYLNGAPISLERLEKPELHIRSRTHDGIESNRQFTDITLQNEQLLVQAFRVPENLASLSFTLRGRVTPHTDDEPVTLQAKDQIQTNGIHATGETASLLLARDGADYVLEIRDKSGNPLPDTVVRLRLKSEDVTDTLNVTLKTDGAGRIDLGTLAGIESVAAQSAGLTSGSWNLVRPRYTYPDSLHGSTAQPLHIPFIGADPESVADAASLLEVRWGAYTADHTSALQLADGYVTISGVPAGDYLLHLKETGQHIKIRMTDAVDSGRLLASKTRLLDGNAPTPLQIQSVEPGPDALTIQLKGLSTLARVHVVATRFQPRALVYGQFDVTATLGASIQTVEPGYALYTSGRQIGDEYRYVLERRFATKFPGNMLERPSLLLNPWTIEETKATQEDAAAGEPPAAMPPPAPQSVREDGEMDDVQQGVAAQAASPSFDFLDGDGAVFYNLQPDENGVVRIPREQLHGRNYVQIVATDPSATVSRYEALPAGDWTPRDLRLADALDPEARLMEQKASRVLGAGDTVDISLTGDADVQLYDSVPTVLGLLSTLNGDARLKEFSFVGRWPSLSVDEKRDKFNEYASHELNLFLYHKDREFFDATVRPYLANKYHKTFMDHWLLEDDLSAYLEPWRLNQLNLVEKILLARRLPEARPAVTAWLDDAIDMNPPDPEGDDRLFMAALLGRGLESAAAGVELDGSIRIRGNFYADEVKRTTSDRAGVGAFGGGGFGGGGGGFGRTTGAKPPETQRYLGERAPAPDRVARKKESPAAAVSTGFRNRVFGESAVEDMAQEASYPALQALYRAPKATEAFVETDYYKRTIEAAHPGMIPVNRFWRDFAEADPGAPFRSRHVAEATTSFTEAMLALAVLDLPFESPAHTANTDDGAYTLEAGGPAIAFYKDIQPAGAAAEEAPVLVSQNYFRRDDRFRYEGNQRLDKFVSDEFLTGEVYGCQVTFTNPTSSPRRIDVLRQIPEGALPVESGRYTKSTPMGLEPYSTARQEYFFYFPEAGSFVHFPVHVSEEGALVAHGDPHPMHVVDEPSEADTTSWQYVSQEGTPDAVLAYLRDANLNRIDFNQVLWRLRDRPFYTQLRELLESRAHYVPAVWAYALHHNDEAGLRTYLRHRLDFVAQAGPALESDLLRIDPVEREFYQHIEYMPLINPRAHDLDGKWRITNEQFRMQYDALMNILAHRESPGQPALFALTYYLLLQDRVEEALAYFERLNPDAVPSRIQYDYMAAYLAFYRAAPDEAEAIAARYADYPVARWRARFADVRMQVAEIAGGSAETGDDPDLDGLAATEPRLELEVREDALMLYHDKLASVDVSYYPVDLEMLFTKQPFGMDESGVYAGVKPVASQTISLEDGASQTEVTLPPAFVSSHVVVTVEAGGIRRTAIRYASKLVAQLVERYGQVKVLDKANNAPLPKIYVKVFARMDDGRMMFYKDGYTDLRGRFDYASSSTLDIGEVREFAILVIGDEHGARVLEAVPPVH